MLTPVRVLDLELSETLPSIGGSYGSALVLVRLHGRPLGTLQLDLAPGAIPAGEVARLVWERLRRAILEHLAADGVQLPDALSEAGLPACETPACQRYDDSSFPFASVVISTHERPGPVAACIESIL